MEALRGFTKPTFRLGTSGIYDDLYARIDGIRAWHDTNKLGGTHLSLDADSYGYCEWILIPAIQTYYMYGDEGFFTLASLSAQDLYTGRDPTTQLLRMADGGGSRVVSEMSKHCWLYDAFEVMAYRDPTTFLTKLQDLMGGIWVYAVDGTTKLGYFNVKSDGSKPTNDSFCAYGFGNYHLAYLMFNTFKLTGNRLYLQYATQIIDACWTRRNMTTNLIPRRFNASTGGTIDASLKQGEEMGDFLQLLAYMVRNGINTVDGVDIRSMLSTSLDEAYNRFWNATHKRWNYHMNCDGSVYLDWAETCFMDLDLGLLLGDLALHIDTHTDRALMDMINHYNELKDSVGRIIHNLYSGADERLMLYQLSYMQVAHVFYSYFGNSQVFKNAETIRSQLNTWKQADGRYRYRYKPSTGGLDSREMLWMGESAHTFGIRHRKGVIRYAPLTFAHALQFPSITDGITGNPLMLLQ